MRTSLLWVAGAAFFLGCAPQAVAPKHVEQPVADPVRKISAAEIVTLGVSAANRFVEAENQGEMLVRLRLGALSAREAKRPPINLALVVDTSGSMEGDPIRDARAASLALLDALSEGDRLAVVSFNSDTEVLVPSTRLDKDTIARVREQIGAMKARGTTDLAGGLRAGIAEVERGFQANGINRVVLLGDGVPNEEAPVLPLAQEAAKKAIPVTVMGLGLDYNETLMGLLAAQSGGKYHFIKESSKVASVFKDEVLRLKQVVARNATVKLTPGPGVMIKEVIGLPTTRTGADFQVGLGDLSEGDERDVVVRVSLSGRRAGAVVELLDSELSFDDAAVGGKRLSERGYVSVRSTGDKGEVTAGKNVDVERSAARATLAERVVRAISMARQGNMGGAQALLDDAERDAHAAAKALDDGELEAEAKNVWTLRKSLPSYQQVQVAAGPPAVVPGGAPPIIRAPAEADARQMPQPAAAAVVLDAQARAMKTLQGSERPRAQR